VSKDDTPITHNLLAIVLVVIFEAAAVLLIVWAVVFQQLSIATLVEVAAFVALLAIGYYYARRAGGFDAR
jgi:NADH:ubiquinone oxidoreductase subunit 3 (subunit A)